MEVFNVFATLSLVDMLSGPLDRIKRAMGSTDATVAGLGQRMGHLAIAMAPVAVAAGVVLGSFGACVRVAAGFEDQMAKVGAVSRASSEEMAALEASARELGATTQFTAVQVGEAEQYLAMAGFSAKENIAALPGVLNLAAATATDLGRAADISSDILSAFGLNAAEMDRVADALALTCATANTNMELLGDTMKYVAPVARMAGLSLEETAAMAGLLGNVGIKGSQAGTTLKAMLNKLAAPTSEAQELFQKLGVTVKDSEGNLRSPVSILGELSSSLKNMGTAEQIAAMKMIVGEEAIAGFSELIEKQGIGVIAEYAAQLEAGGGSAAEMAARMNDTLGGSLRSLGSAWESVQITVGKLFLPAVRAAADTVTGFLRLLDKAAQSKFGAALIKLAAALATGVAALTAFSAGMWAVSKVGPVVLKSLLPIKTALLSLGAPVYAVIAVLGLLYAAYKTNFGGMADYLSGVWKKITLTVKGVLAVFDSLKNGVGEIRGDLATQIKAEGLTGLVTTVSRVAYRIREFFSGLWSGLNLDGVLKILAPALAKVQELFSFLGETIGRVFGFEVTSASSEARSLGEILGGALSVGLELVATLVANVARGIDALLSLFRMVCAVLTGDWSTAAAMAENIWNDFCDSLMAFADLFRIGDWLRNAWASAKEAISSFGASLISGLQSAWDGVRNGISAAWNGYLALLSGFWGSILSGIQNFGSSLISGLQSAWNTVSGAASAAWDGISSMVSGACDALVGTVSAAWNAIVSGLSSFGASLLTGISEAWNAVLEFFGGLNLFDSGARLLSTFVEGIKSMATSVVDSVANVFAKVREYLPFSDAHVGPLSQLTLSGARMMTTLAEGVNGAQGGLVSSVSGALAGVGGAIRDWWNGLGNPAKDAAPELPKPPVPEVPPAVPQTAATDMPPLRMETEIPPLPSLEVRAGALPEMPELGISAPAMPDLPDLEAPEIPQPPSFESQANRASGRAAGGGQGGQNISIYGNIVLPGVQKAEEFGEALRRCLQGEISMMEGMA